MTGTASIRAVADGIELRQGRNTVRLYRTQVIPFCNFATDWFETLEQRKEQEQQ